MKSSSFELTEKIVLRNFNLSCHRKAAKMPSWCQSKLWAELPPGYARNLNYKHLRWDILQKLQRFLPFDADSSIKFLMKLFGQRDVSSCPRHCKGNFETWMLPTHSRHNITFHPWFLLCFLPFPPLEVHTRFAGEEITKIFFYFAWHEYARHPKWKWKEIMIWFVWRRQRSNPKAPTKLVCHIEGFKFMQLWVLSSLAEEIRRLSESAEIYLFLLESHI